MGCCTTKQSTQKKNLYEDKSANKQVITTENQPKLHQQQQQPIEKDKIREQPDENKTTVHTENKTQKNDASLTKENEKVQSNEQNNIHNIHKNNDNIMNSNNINSTPTPGKNDSIQNNNTNNINNNGQNIQQSILQSVNQNTVEIKKVGSLYINNNNNVQENQDILKQQSLLKSENQVVVDPNSLKGASQTLSIQQMRLSKIDKSSTFQQQNQEHNKENKDQSGSEYELQDEPNTNMQNYGHQKIQNKGMKENILNKHMRSILNSLKQNEYVSKSCYSTPPVLLVDNNNQSNSGQWMQVETFGIYGKAEQQNDSHNFMDD